MLKTKLNIKKMKRQNLICAKKHLDNLGQQGAGKI